MAKLVDAPSSGGGAARCAGSNPVPGTTKSKTLVNTAFDKGFAFSGEVGGSVQKFLVLVAILRRL